MTILAKVANVTKSANLAENLPWVWRIFKLDGKRAPALASGDFDKMANLWLDRMDRWTEY